MRIRGIEDLQIGEWYRHDHWPKTMVRVVLRPDGALVGVPYKFVLTGRLEGWVPDESLVLGELDNWDAIRMSHVRKDSFDVL